METLRPDRVSVLDPIDWAIERVKLVLFRSFSMSKWFAVGFCAWLAYLGQGGGSFNFRGDGGSFKSGSEPSFEHARNVIVENLFWIIPVAVIAILFFIAISILILWLSSRGRFMFLHSVVTNTSQIKAPWRHFAQRANSMFVFRFVLGLIGFFAMLPLIAGIGFCMYLLIEKIGVAMPIAFLVILALLTIFACLVFGIISKFTNDFITPVMYVQNCLCTEAWRRLLPLIKVNKARLILYLLFQIVISMAIGVLIMGACCITCCCLGIIFAIPYIGTVALLPVLVFKRAYSIFYLRQFGNGFDVFAEAV